MKKTGISEDILIRYAYGMATLEEIALVSMAMKEDSAIKEIVDDLKQLHAANYLAPHDNDLPALNAAAAAEGNLCDVLCEKYILQDYLNAEELDSVVSAASENEWLKDSGTPLHHIGRLLEKKGMSVKRQFGGTIEDVSRALQDKCRVITVVDYGALLNQHADGVYHAVVFLRVDDVTVRIYDPAMDGNHNYPRRHFEIAWAESNNYLVTASATALPYSPHPIDVSDVELDEDLIELSESIAENAHEIWAKQRKDEGWRYGRERNDILKLTPDYVPYSELPEMEKDIDRFTTMGTIRLIHKLGFRIIRRYTLFCPNCGEYVSDTMKYCPECGGKLGQN